MARLRMDIGGMTCARCEQTVAAALRSAGAGAVRVDHRRGQATFKLDEDAGAGPLAEAVRAAGYAPGVVEAGEDELLGPGEGRGGDGDLVVVGSGGAAFAAAIRATDLGARVTMVERGEVGGTCVNVGCVPSKTLLAAAGALHTAAAHPFAGLPTSAGTPDLSALVAQKDELVGRLRRSKYIELAGAYGFDIVRGQARFRSPDELEVDGRVLRADAYVVATGAVPRVPELPGLVEAGYLTSTTAMDLHELPGRMVVIGGGFVGVEQSQLFARLGVRVTLVGRLVPRAEPELAAWMVRIFADEGIDVVPERAVSAGRDGDGRFVVTDAGRRLPADAILVAAGRQARTDGLGLDAARVNVDGRGFVTVDEELRTSNPAVFAAGDVTGGPQYVYVAAAQGNVAADNAVGNAHRRMDYSGLPSVIFTDPALAGAGLTEAQARAAGHECECRVLELADIPRALANRDTRGAIKLVADRRSGRVLGVHALAAGAGDMVLAGVYAVRFGLTVDDLATTWAPYLTMSEGLKLVAQSFRTDVARLSCCAG